MAFRARGRRKRRPYNADPADHPPLNGDIGRFVADPALRRSLMNHPFDFDPMNYIRLFLRTRAHAFALAVALFAINLHAATTEAPITITLDPAKAAAAIAPDFNGLSYEITALLPVNGVRYFRPDNTALLTLFHTLGLRHLRVGGNTSDRNATQLPTEADWDSLFAFAKAADVKVLYCLRLHEGEPAAAAATVKYIMDHYAPRVDAVSIGQEPSAYPSEKVDTRPPGERMGAAVEKYPYTSYRDHWQEFATAIVAAVPNVKFCGPSVHNNAEWARKFIEDFGRDHHVGLVTEHLYAGGAAGKLPSAEVGRDRMLSGEFLKVYEKLHEGFVPAARAAGLPYRLEEVNSYFNGGALDASDTFAATLWGLEFMHWWAVHEAAGLDFHTGDRVSMNGTVSAPRYATFLSAPDGFTIRPLAYAFKAFDLGGHGRVVPLTLDNPATLNLTAYATLADDGSITVTLINKEHGGSARDGMVTIPRAAKQANGRMILLQAPGGDVATKEGLTLGGGAIEKDGSWHGAWQPLPAPAADATQQIRIPAASAAVIRFGP
jgi:hypothetical protein